MGELTSVQVETDCHVVGLQHSVPPLQRKDNRRYALIAYLSIVISRAEDIKRRNKPTNNTMRACQHSADIPAIQRTMDRMEKQMWMDDKTETSDYGVPVSSNNDKK